MTHLGRVVPEAQDPELRELIEGNYRIVYRIVSQDLVSVIRIVHAKKRKLRL